MMSRTLFTPVLLRPISSPSASCGRMSIAIGKWRDWLEWEFRWRAPKWLFSSGRVAFYYRNAGFFRADYAVSVMMNTDSRSTIGDPRFHHGLAFAGRLIINLTIRRRSA